VYFHCFVLIVPIAVTPIHEAIESKISAEPEEAMMTQADVRQCVSCLIFSPLYIPYCYYPVFRVMEFDPLATGSFWLEFRTKLSFGCLFVDTRNFPEI